MEEAKDTWSDGHSHPIPVGELSHMQKTWDNPQVTATGDALLESAADAASRARLLAAKEFGMWLPILSLGLHMDNQTVVVVGLCLGTPLCQPYTFCHCGAEVIGYPQPEL